MIQLKFFRLAFVLILLSACQSYAGVCLRAENIQDLKKDFPIVIVGEVLRKEPSQSSLGNVKLEIGIVELLKGKLDINTISGYTMEVFPEAERPSYKVGGKYAFPVKERRDSKNNKQYVLEAPSQGCTLFPILERK